MKTVPGAGSQSRARRSPSVDLPLPVGPTTATVSPAPTAKLTPRSAGGRPSYANVKFSNRIAGEWLDTGDEEIGLGSTEPGRSSSRPPTVRAGLAVPATTV